MHAHGREAAGGLVYERHRPEDTRLYRLVEQHYPAFVEHLAEQGMALPAYVPLIQTNMMVHSLSQHPILTLKIMNENMLNMLTISPSFIPFMKVLD